MRHLADDVDWQQTARQYKPGDAVNLLHGDASDVGRVVAVWPAIGMLDVQFSSGWTRKPVEEVIKVDATNGYVPPLVEVAQVPGGLGTVPVSAGPAKAASVTRVADAFEKKSLYWALKDRQYKPTCSEVNSGQYTCPKCKEALVSTRYKRREGVSERLLACRNCLFLIKPQDAGLGDC